MPRSYGYRAGTRYKFSREYKKRGILPSSVFLQVYKTGDYVDIKVNGSIQKGMPHRIYHGRTGVVFAVNKSTVGVIIHKRRRERYIEKKVYVRIEHIKPSKCREEYTNRVKRASELKKLVKKDGKKLSLKRMPQLPTPAHIVSTKDNEPITITPVPYETYI